MRDKEIVWVLQGVEMMMMMMMTGVR